MYYHWININLLKNNYSHLQKFKTRHDFQAFLCYVCLISCFYCISLFGLKKGCFREHVREKKERKKHTSKQQQQKYKLNQKDLDVITFHIVLYYALGEVDLYNCYEGQKIIVLSNLLKYSCLALILNFCKWLTTQSVDSFVNLFFRHPYQCAYVCLQFGPERSGIRCAAQAGYTSQPYQQRPATQQRRLRLLVACLFGVVFVCASMSASDPPHLSLTSMILCPAHDEQLHLACRSPYVSGCQSAAHLCEQFLFGDQCVLFWEREKKTKKNRTPFLSFALAFFPPYDDDCSTPWCFCASWELPHWSLLFTPLSTSRSEWLGHYGVYTFSWW